MTILYFIFYIVAGDEDAAKVIADLQQKLAAKQGMKIDFQ